MGLISLRSSVQIRPALRTASPGTCRSSDNGVYQGTGRLPVHVCPITRPVYDTGRWVSRTGVSVEHVCLPSRSGEFNSRVRYWSGFWEVDGSTPLAPRWGVTLRGPNRATARQRVRIPPRPRGSHDRVATSCPPWNVPGAGSTGGDALADPEDEQNPPESDADGPEGNDPTGEKGGPTGTPLLGY